MGEKGFLAVFSREREDDSFDKEFSAVGQGFEEFSARIARLDERLAALDAREKEDAWASAEARKRLQKTAELIREELASLDAKSLHKAVDDVARMRKDFARLTERVDEAQKAAHKDFQDVSADLSHAEKERVKAAKERERLAERLDAFDSEAERLARIEDRTEGLSKLLTDVDHRMHSLERREKTRQSAIAELRKDVGRLLSGLDEHAKARDDLDHLSGALKQTQDRLSSVTERLESVAGTAQENTERLAERQRIDRSLSEDVDSLHGLLDEHLTGLDARIGALIEKVRREEAAKVEKRFVKILSAQRKLSERLDGIAGSTGGAERRVVTDVEKMQAEIAELERRFAMGLRQHEEQSEEEHTHFEQQLDAHEEIQQELLEHRSESDILMLVELIHADLLPKMSRASAEDYLISHDFPPEMVSEAFRRVDAHNA